MRARGARRRVLRIAGVAGTIVVLSVALTPTALADEDDRIVSFEATLTLSEDGNVGVYEKITYDFGATAGSAIERRMQVRFRHGDDPLLARVYDVGNIYADAIGSQQVTVDTRTEGDDLVIAVDAADVSQPGVRVFNLSYRVRGVYNHFDTHDELYWDATGRWAVPIRSSTITIVGGGLSTAECRIVDGDEQRSCGPASFVGDGIAGLTGGRLRPGASLVVVAALQPGAIADTEPIVARKWSFTRAFSVTPLTLALTLSAALLTLPWIGARLARGRYVDRVDRDAVTVEFRPPDGLRPAQMGVLLDERVDPADVSATIVDLAVRRHLRIEEVEGGGASDWKLHRTPNPADPLAAFESVLLDGLFGSSGQPTLLPGAGTGIQLNFQGHVSPELQQSVAQMVNIALSMASAFSPTLGGSTDPVARLETYLYADAVARGYYRSSPRRVRREALALGITGLVLSLGGLVALAILTTYALVAVPLVVASIALIAGHRALPVRTKRGQDALRRVYGFREFVVRAETGRLEFAEKENLLSDYLPYAVMFGVVDRWRHVFDGIDISKAAGAWFSGGGWSVAAFGSSLAGFTQAATQLVRLASQVSEQAAKSSLSQVVGASSPGAGGAPPP